MSLFTIRNILTSQTIGERLAKVRQGNSLTLGDVARALGIKRQYLEAIEVGHYADLPGDIYALEFIKSYARALRLDADRAAEEYRRERESERRRQAPSRRFTFIFAPKQGRRRKISLFFLRLGLVLPALALFFYGINTLFRVVLPPRLEVFSPSPYYEMTGSLIAFSGQAAPGSRVFINSQELPVDESGAFNETFNLAPGLTLFKITARNGTAREQSVYRVVRAGGGQVAGASVKRVNLINN